MRIEEEVQLVSIILLMLEFFSWSMNLYVIVHVTL